MAQEIILWVNPTLFPPKCIPGLWERIVHAVGYGKGLRCRNPGLSVELGLERSREKGREKSETLEIANKVNDNPGRVARCEREMPQPGCERRRLGLGSGRGCGCWSLGMEGGRWWLGGDRRRVGAPVAPPRDPERVPVPVGSPHPVHGAVGAGVEEGFWHRGTICRWPGLMRLGLGLLLPRLFRNHQTREKRENTFQRKGMVVRRSSYCPGREGFIYCFLLHVLAKAQLRPARGNEQQSGRGRLTIKKTPLE